MAWVARGLGGLVPGAPEPPGEMDLRQVGLLYLLLTVVIFAFAIWRGVPPLLAALFLYVLVDPGYLLFFNSFYADPALLVAVVGIVLWMARTDFGVPLVDGTREERTAAGVLLGCLVVLGGGSKMQYAPLPAVVCLTLAVACIATWGRLGQTPRSRRLGPSLLLAVLGAVAVATPLHFMIGSGPRFPLANNFHAVYAGILQVSSEPEQVLEELAIPRQHWDLPRKDMWSGKVTVDNPVHAHLADLSRRELLWLYLEDPGAILAAGRKIQRELARLESHTRGSFVRSPEHPRRQQLTTWWRFARWRQEVMGRWPAVLWWLLAGSAGWLGVAAWKRRWTGTASAGLFLLAFTTTQYIVVVLGDGFVALEQHLIGARFALDLLFVVMGWEVVRALGRRLAPVTAPARSPPPPPTPGTLAARSPAARDFPG